jgi:imidazolonepropionase-like amidohydrolase
MTRTVFTRGRVFDGTGAALADADVVIEDGRIVEVGSGLDGDDEVDCSGKALLPGLFDCHAHLAFRHEDLDEVRVMNEPFSVRFFRMAENLRTTLALGITTVRDASGADAGLKLAVEEGTLVGPRMRISVQMLSMTGGHADAWLPSGALASWSVEYPGMPSGVCDGVDGVSAKVREVIRAGADVIKIASSGGFLSPSDDPRLPNFSQAEVDAIVATAADLGCWVMSHAHGAEGIKRAVRAGVRSIDHGTFLDEEGAAMMTERGTWLVPTLTAGDTTDLPPRRRRRCEGRDGHRLPGRAPRHEPARAPTHVRARPQARAGARRGHLQRGRADGPAGRTRHARARLPSRPRRGGRRPVRLRHAPRPRRRGLEGRCEDRAVRLS